MLTIINSKFKIAVNTIDKKIHDCISTSASAFESIKIAYVFGSILDETSFKSTSDIDLAFLLDQHLYRKDPLTASYHAYNISTEIGLALDKQTDVLILNSASIETAFQVITTGNALYEYNTEDRIQYEIALKGMYFDFKPFLNIVRSNTL
ncbi:MAG: hypothetical protein DRH93_16050 [Deltaproteobacteria bacterium]|nr:MAG: hypothetical protein DRH93_16050 [Deltaproteobacteria bacterium]